MDGLISETNYPGTSYNAPATQVDKKCLKRYDSIYCFSNKGG